MKKFFLSILIILVLLVLGIFGYVAYDYLSVKNSLRFDLIPSQNDVDNSNASTTVATSTIEISTSTIDTASWKNYSNEELGFAVKYPSNLIVNNGGNLLILAFPKKTYFHWPLEDDEKLTVVASTTCTGPSILAEYEEVSTSTLIMDGQSFARTEGSGVGAGNIYKKISYDILSGGTCYSLILDTHGSNGAGLYVDDPILIKKYDSQHSVDADAIMKVVYGILGNFKILTASNP
jgi:hypothetical protein